MPACCQPNRAAANGQPVSVEADLADHAIDLQHGSRSANHFSLERGSTSPGPCLRSYAGPGPEKRPAGIVRHLSAGFLGLAMLVLSLPTTACGDLACGDQCAGGSCAGQDPKACSKFTGCQAVSTCACAVYGTCSSDDNRACAMSQSKAECDTLSACAWLTFCHQSKSCDSIGDAATCSASGCLWEHNCN